MIFFVLIFVGCENSNFGSGSSPSGNSGTETTDEINAEDATGIWNESQVRQYITEELKLSSVELTSTRDGNYTATGQNAEGL